MRRVNLRSMRLALPILCFTTFLFIFPIFKGLRNWGIGDWTYFYTCYGISRRSILSFKQIPLWNPWLSGGNVHFGHPREGSLSPFFLPILILGPVLGLKVSLIVYLILGALGMFSLAKRFNLTTPALYLCSFLWCFNGWMSMHLAIGHVNHFPMLLLPLVFLFYLKSLEKGIYLLASAAIFALMFFSAGDVAFLFTALFLALYSCLLAIRMKSWRPLKSVALVALFTFLFTAVKLLPTLEFFSHIGPIGMIHLLGLEMNDLFSALLYRSRPIEANITALGSWEFGAYIGLVPLGLFLLRMVLYFFKRKTIKFPQGSDLVLIIVGLVFCVAALGNRAPVDLLSLLRRLPVLSSLHGPLRFIILFIFVLSLLAGRALSLTQGMGLNLKARVFNSFLALLLLLDLEVLLWPHNKIICIVLFVGFIGVIISLFFRQQIFRAVQGILPVVLVLYVLGNFIFYNSLHFEDIFVIEPPDVKSGEVWIKEPKVTEKWGRAAPFLITRIGKEEEKEFYQRLVPDFPGGHDLYTYFMVKPSSPAMYLSFLRNKGTLNSYEPIDLPGAAKAQGDPLYRGEVYLAGGNGSASIIYFSPNKIVVRASAEDEDIVVLNQNYHRGWQVKGKGRAINFKGLIATPISAGMVDLVFCYLPRIFLLGLFITIVTLLSIGGFFLSNFFRHRL